jgi:hypothetical protein
MNASSSLFLSDFPNSGTSNASYRSAYNRHKSKGLLTIFRLRCLSSDNDETLEQRLSLAIKRAAGFARTPLVVLQLGVSVTDQQGKVDRPACRTNEHLTAPSIQAMGDLQPGLYFGSGPAVSQALIKSVPFWEFLE